jgi:tungstate transport system permease protein
MDDLLRGLEEALRLMARGDSEKWQIVALSMQVSGLALLFGSLLGVPLGALLGLRQFLGRRLMIALIYTGMGFPPVVVGLFVYLLLSRSGPLGDLGWLFTPSAMALAQTIIALPLIAGLTMSAVLGVSIRRCGYSCSRLARRLLRPPKLVYGKRAAAWSSR